MKHNFFYKVRSAAYSTTILVFIISLLSSLNSYSQGFNKSNNTEIEQKLLMETKQVNQFFRRFNNEEDAFGLTYSTEDEMYRNNGFRHVYLDILFDNETGMFSSTDKQAFIAEISDKKNPLYLEFETGNWYAEVDAIFLWENELRHAQLYFTIEQEGLGYQWVLSNVSFPPFETSFFNENDSIKVQTFLHPLSHEIDFINLNKAFRDNNKVWYYTSKNFTPNYLSIFLYEIQHQRLRFVNVGSLQFHFLQPENWYFSLEYFNRNSKNSGWLISNVFRTTTENTEELKAIFGDNE